MKNIPICSEIDLLPEANLLSEVDLLRRHSTGHDIGRNGRKLALRCNILSGALLLRQPPLYLRCPTSIAPPPPPSSRAAAPAQWPRTSTAPGLRDLGPLRFGF